MTKNISNIYANGEARDIENSCVTVDDKDVSQDLSPTPTQKVNLIEKPRSAIRSPQSATSSSGKIENKPTRNAKFSSTVHICLVLSRTEMKPLMSDLFWKAEEYAKFKNDAISELRAHLTANGITAKEAIFDMYQPHDLEREQWLAEYGNSTKSDSDSDSDSTQTVSDTDDEYLHDLDDVLNIDEDEELRNAKKMANFKFDELNTEMKVSSIDSLQRPTPKTVSNKHDWAVSWRPKARSSY